MDFELLDELVNRLGTLPQCGELLLCSCLSIRICKYEVNLGFKLFHHHWHPGGVEDLLDLMHMYRVHYALKRLRSSCRPVNGVGVVILRSLVVAGGGGRSTGGDGVQALSWFCSAWICCMRSATCSSSVAMMVGNGNKEGERF